MKKRRAKPAADYALERQVGHLLRRAHQRATAIFLAELGEAYDVTPRQFAALVKLHELGAQSQNELGRLTAMDPATIQGVIRRLVARQLIERSGDPGDRRRATLRLTARGRALVRRTIPLGFKVSDRTLAPLPAAESRRFLRLLRMLAYDGAPSAGSARVRRRARS
jgi:MarR family transcriptional regulator, lower aerobic nicotinate degradation pathway regulator